MKQLKRHKDKLKFVKNIFKENPDIERYFANDSESNFQKDNGRCIAGYNCQSAVDEKNKLIINTDVTNENNDLHQLNNMKKNIDDVKKDLEVEKKTIGIADAGYHSETEILELIEDESIDIYIPHPRDVKTKEKQGREKKDKIPAKDFEKENFKYDNDKDEFICPEGKILKKCSNGSISNGVKKIKYQCKECRDCKSSDLCYIIRRNPATFSGNTLPLNPA